MADLPILFVAGFGRCGTTMVMTMLDAGGFAVAGARPDYEPAEHWSRGRPDPAWLMDQTGKAMKWIDPLRGFDAIDRMRPALARPVIILMERNPREQSRSQVKLIEAGAPGAGLGRRAEKGLERGIRQDTPFMRARLLRLARSQGFYAVNFEDVLKGPIWMAEILEQIVSDHFGRRFDAQTAARAVIPRHASCAPDLRMEAHILPMIAAEMNARAALQSEVSHG